VNDTTRQAKLDKLAEKTWIIQGKWDSSAMDYCKEMLPGAELVRFYESILDGAPEPWKVLGRHNLSDRKCDRALQILKRAGLIEYVREVRAWRAVP
jgi:hypothetical protein